MGFYRSKNWWIERAKREGDANVSAGVPAMPRHMCSTGTALRKLCHDFFVDIDGNATQLWDHIQGCPQCEQSEEYKW